VSDEASPGVAIEVYIFISGIEIRVKAELELTAMRNPSRVVGPSPVRYTTAPESDPYSGRQHRIPGVDRAKRIDL